MRSAAMNSTERRHARKACWVSSVIGGRAEAVTARRFHRRDQVGLARHDARRWTESRNIGLRQRGRLAVLRSEGDGLPGHLRRPVGRRRRLAVRWLWLTVLRWLRLTVLWWLRLAVWWLWLTVLRWLWLTVLRWLRLT